MRRDLLVRDWKGEDVRPGSEIAVAALVGPVGYAFYAFFWVVLGAQLEDELIVQDRGIKEEDAFNRIISA